VDTNFFPKSLLQDTKKSLGSEFSDLTDKFQAGYTCIFWNHSGVIKHNQHNQDVESFKMPRKEVESYFTDQRDFRAVNDNGYYLGFKKTRHGVSNKASLSRKETEGFTYHPPTNWIIKTVEAYSGGTAGKGCTSGYKLTPNIINILDIWNNKAEEDIKEHSGWINTKGESIIDVTNKLKGGIVRNKSNVSKSINVDVMVKVDIEALTKHKEQLTIILNYLEGSNVVEGSRSREEEAIAATKGKAGVKVKHIIDNPLSSLINKGFNSDGIKQRITEINRLLLTSRELGNNNIPVIYEEVSTGRYTAKGAVIQGYHKSVRYAALKGCYEYDLEAAHQNILLQLLERKGVDFPELETIREYTENKQEIRVKLSEELDTDIDIVKRILQSLTYGAQLSTSNKCSLYETCDDILLLHRVVNNTWLKNYKSMFNKAHKHIVGSVDKITNAVGITKETKSKSKAIAHILQGYERLILDALVENSSRNDIALLLHDCVIFYNKHSPAELSAIVKEKTGFNLEFSEEKY
jgi:hypothetical protein